MYTSNGQSITLDNDDNIGWQCIGNKGLKANIVDVPAVKEK